MLEERGSLCCKVAQLACSKLSTWGGKMAAGWALLRASTTCHWLASASRTTRVWHVEPWDDLPNGSGGCAPGVCWFRDGISRFKLTLGQLDQFRRKQRTSQMFFLAFPEALFPSGYPASSLFKYGGRAGADATLCYAASMAEHRNGGLTQHPDPSGCVDRLGG